VHPTQMFYLPLAPTFFFALVAIFLVIVLIYVLELRLIQYAYMQLGLSPQSALLLLFGSLIGSSINIPVAQIPNHVTAAGEIIEYFGMQYQAPLAADASHTIIAVNVGGAVIPVVMSIYLLFRYGLWLKSLIATGVVTAVCYYLAYPIAGLGVALPIFVPVIATAIIAIILDRSYVAPIAYVAGSLGPLIGADLMNLGKVFALGVPIASIGGAGTFDGIFVTGVVAVLLGSLVGPRAGKSLAARTSSFSE
jgi:uncharacterized membrane protein